jgi:hypothetical protein
MIDHSLVISPVGAVLFHLKQAFWLYAWPMMIGFLTILGYQGVGRIAMQGTTKWPVIFGLASVVSMVTLFGWVTMVRSMQMIPFYGCGVGLASATMSRIYAITTPLHPRLKMRIIRVIWRGDAEGIDLLRQALHARSAAPPGPRAGTSVEAVRAGV